MLADTDSDIGDNVGIDQLKERLRKALEEKDVLATQHHNLLSKITTMRNTLGEKLKQDAEELDRQEQVIQALTAERDDLAKTLEVLQQELRNAHKEVEDTNAKYDGVRGRMQAIAHDTLIHEREVRELQNQLEQCRLDRDEWMRSAEKEKAVVEEIRTELEEARREVGILKDNEDEIKEELEKEKEKARNLQAVLQDFQAGKDHELEQAVKDYESQLSQVTQSLAEYKSRALNAELQLEELQSTTTQTAHLRDELKSKNLLIGKLRHEAVIMNEHLIEALRRLRRASTETRTSVDTRLVTNIVLAFLTTPREDTKRFEMLGLLANVLNWGDEERMKAGLKKANGSHGKAAAGFWGRGERHVEVEKSDETESFSRLWVEFLLKESSSATEDASPSISLPPSGSASSLPGSPTMSSFSALSINGDNNRPQQKRLASLGAAVSAGMASTPNLVGKGKERARD